LEGPDVLVIVNPAAARGAGARLWPRLEPALRARFPGLTVRATEAPGDAERWAGEWADLHPDDPVIAVGGDGTVHEVVNGLLRERPTCRLGVISAGTGNDFARNTGIPADPHAAAQRMARGTAARIDAGRVEFSGDGGTWRARTFVNSASVGVSPRANHIAGSVGRMLPGRIRYALGGILALLAERAGSYTVTSAGRILHQGRALNLTFANGPSFGGGMRISPGSVMTDGVIEQVVIGDLGRVRALLALSRLYAGTHIGMRGIGVSPLRETVQVTREDGGMLLETDGEEWAAGRELTVRVLPGAIALL
jgi:diacylglycerol kinase (ATP)